MFDCTGEMEIDNFGYVNSLYISFCNEPVKTPSQVNEKSGSINTNNMKCIIIINCSFVNVRQWDKDKMDHRIYTIFWKCFLLYNVIEHYSAWVFSCKSAVYFPKNTSGGLLLTEWSLNQKISEFFIFSSALYAIEGLQMSSHDWLDFQETKNVFCRYG